MKKIRLLKPINLNLIHPDKNYMISVEDEYNMTLDHYYGSGDGIISKLAEVFNQEGKNPERLLNIPIC